MIVGWTKFLVKLNHINGNESVLFGNSVWTEWYSHLASLTLLIFRGLYIEGNNGKAAWMAWVHPLGSATAASICHWNWFDLDISTEDEESKIVQAVKQGKYETIVL